MKLDEAMKRVSEDITEKEEKDFCRNCDEFCSRHCVIWRKAEMRHDEAERMTKLGIKETVAKWKDRLEQEPCEDAVSRKAVLNTLDKMDSVLDENRTVETYKELLIACYKALPSVTSVYKKEWIPCSVKMPKPNETVGGVSKYYLVQDIYGDIYIARYTTSGWIPEHSRFVIASDDVVVAWMLLPEPYKAEMEGEE